MIDKDHYYMAIARAVATRANCAGRKVGAVLVREDRIMTTGYNGTPSAMTNCLEGGCTRCGDREQFTSGTAYDLCLCVHAEANAIATAARFGVAVQGSVLYCTHQPCFSCSKELIQAGITQVWFDEAWPPDVRVSDDYARLQEQLSAALLSPDPVS
jgi:dCMP deaminase